MDERKNLLVLVYFYEENQFSVLKLRDAVDSSQLAEIDVKLWDPKKSVETKWDNHYYPANFLQFGGKFRLFYFLNCLLML